MVTDLEQRRDTELRPWVARATVLIWDRIADARAHAEAGRMDRALERLEELRRGLLDDQTGKGSLLSNARAAFYRQAFHHHQFDQVLHDPVRPDQAGELAARYSQIAGRNQYQDLRRAIEEMTAILKRLQAVVAQDANKAERFDAWQTRERDRLIGLVTTVLSDAQVALSEAVSRIRVKPELR